MLIDLLLGFAEGGGRVPKCIKFLFFGLSSLHRILASSFFFTIDSEIAPLLGFFS